MSTDRHLTVAEVAEILGASERTIYRMVLSGRLPHRRLSSAERGGIRIPESALDGLAPGRPAKAKPAPAKRKPRPRGAAGVRVS